MITPDKRIKEDSFANITDYSSVRPIGCKHFYAYFDFTDKSYMLLDRIFAVTRAEAIVIALNRMGDAMNYLTGIRLYQDDDD